MTVLGLAFGQRQVMQEKIASSRQLYQWAMRDLHVAARRSPRKKRLRLLVTSCRRQEG